MKTNSKDIPLADAINYIHCDMANLVDAHKGFFGPAELPFEPPVHGPRGIIVWPPSHIHPGATIGDSVIIGRFVNICGAITIGAKTRIQGHCFIPDAVEIGEKVFIGPGVMFCNVKYPRVRSGGLKDRDGKVVVEDRASIGAGAIICPGVRIGAGALVGAGATVTRDVLPGIIVVGTPSRTHEGK